MVNLSLKSMVTMENTASQVIQQVKTCVFSCFLSNKEWHFVASLPHLT